MSSICSQRTMVSKTSANREFSESRSKTVTMKVFKVE